MDFTRIAKGIKRRTSPYFVRREVQTQIDALKSHTMFCRNVDLCRPHDFFIFMYEDDIPYIQTPTVKRRQHTKFSPAQITAEAAKVAASANRKFLCDYDPVAGAVHALGQNGPVNLLYVGVNYGPHLFNLSDYVRKSGTPCRVLAFDPGVASGLTPLNIEVNGFSKLIEFHKVAVSDADGLTIMNQTIGWSWDNKLVNDADQDLRVANVVRTRSIDSLADELKIQGPTILVIDTQGHEPEVLAGAAKFLATNDCVVFTEFTPWALNPRVKDTEFLASLLKIGEIHNIPHITTTENATEPNVSGRAELLGQRVTQEGIAEFAKEVEASTLHWTDLAVIPRGPNLDAVRTYFNLA